MPSVMLSGVPARFAFLDAPAPLAFSHRGVAPDGIENSMTAFQRAVDLGYRYLETDVHATRDGVVVALHDRGLQRVAGIGGRVADITWQELRSVRIGGREAIPRLTDLLEAWPHARFNLDVKAGPAVEPLAATLLHADAVDRVCVASFSDRRVAAVRRAIGPSLCTSPGPRGVAQLRAVSLGRLPARWSPRAPGCVQVPERAGPLSIVTPAFVRAAHAAGLQVHVWTVNDAAAMARLLDLGVDGIMTDRAEVLRDVLRARGAWAGQP